MGTELAAASRLFIRRFPAATTEVHTKELTEIAAPAVGEVAVMAGSGLDVGEQARG